MDTVVQPPAELQANTMQILTHDPANPVPFFSAGMPLEYKERYCATSAKVGKSHLGKSDWNEKSSGPDQSIDLRLRDQCTKSTAVKGEINMLQLSKRFFQVYDWQEIDGNSDQVAAIVARQIAISHPEIVSAHPLLLLDHKENAKSPEVQRIIAIKFISGTTTILPLCMMLHGDDDLFQHQRRLQGETSKRNRGGWHLGSFYLLQKFRAY
jgi:hypothetical protein